MKVDIKIPPLGESVSEATVARILKPSGSFVRVDEEIIELETDKVNQPLYALQNGVIHFSVEQGATVRIGQVIGAIDTQAEAPSKATSTPPPMPPPAPQNTPPSIPPSQASSIRQTPVDFAKTLQTMPPSPPPEPVPPSSSTSSRKKMTQLRKVIAQRLVEAKNQTAMLTTFNEVDMSAIIDIRSKEKDPFLKKHGVKLGFMSFFVKGVVAALKAIPALNASIEGDEILQYHTYDIGIAVSTDRGLMVPVVKNCDQLDFGGIELALEKYANKAREGSITIDDLRGGSFTITNGGVFGSLLSTPILNPPQSAILGMHAIVKRPVAINDQIVIRPMMYLALSYDHRIVDGREAVLFLVNLKQNLEDPTRLLLDL